MALGALVWRGLGFIIAVGLVGIAHAGGTVVVEPVGSPAANGAALLAAMASITDADEDNRYVIKVGPGVYDLGKSSLVGKPFVGLEGSGFGILNDFAIGFPGATITSIAGNGTILVGHTAVVTHLLVQHTAGGPAILVDGPPDPSLLHAVLTDLTVRVFGGAVFSGPGNRGISFRPSPTAPLTVNHMTVARARVTVGGRTPVGIECIGGPGGALDVKDSLVDVGSSDPKAVGIFAGGGCRLDVRNAEVNSTDLGIRVGLGSTGQISHSRVYGLGVAVSTGGTVEIFSSALNGGVGGAGIKRCAGNTNAALLFFANTCP